MKTKKLLSILLALVMMLSVVPFYASAAPIALTASNIVTYPTAEYINDGVIYYGQKVGDAISFSGGEVQYNGVTVAGHFEHIDMNAVPTSTGAQRADIKFVPNDETSYTGFESARCRYVTYNVSKTTPVFADAENDPLVATEVEAGAKLSTSTLSGGKMINPYNADEAKITARAWEWSNPDIIINESGYYEAMFVPAGYEKTTAQVYVKIAGDIPETEIAEMPTITDFVYNPNLTWKNVKIEGGKAVLKGTETEIEGSFIVANNAKDWIPNAGSNSVPVVFTPNDTETAHPYSLNISVTVNPCPISFGEDHKGTSIDDPFEYEVEPGTQMQNVLYRLQGGYLNYPTPSVTGIEDANSYAENGKVYKVTVLNYTNTNYIGSEAYIKTVFKAATVPMEIRTTGEGANNYYIGTTDSNSPRPQGTYDIYVDGELYLENSPANFVFAPEKSGEYTVKVVYNPTENDYCIVEDIEKVIKVTHKRTVNRINTISDGYLSVFFGDTVEVTENLGESFDRWVITDAQGNEVDLGIDLTQVKISFTMPDYDITVEAKLKGASSGDDTDEPSGGLDDIFGDLTEGDSDSPIVNIFNNILAWFRNLLETIKNFFRGIGDRT